MKILQLYHKVPFPAHDGGACSLLSFSKSLLHQNHELSILAMNTSRAPCDQSQIPEWFTKQTRFSCVMTDNSINPLAAGISLVTGRSYFSQRFICENFRRKLIELLSFEEFNIIQLEHLYLCHYLEDIRAHSNAVIVLRAQNVENLVWKTYAEQAGNSLSSAYIALEARKLERFEREIVRNVDGIIALTEQDAEWFKFAGARSKIIAIPFGVELPDPENGKGHETDIPAFYHIGSMDWRPNIQGMKWFVRNILPKAVKINPDIHVSLAGRNMPPWFFKNAGPNLSVTGEIPEDDQFYQGKNVMIVPLLSGSGIRVKILMAMAAGKAVISTSIGVRGILAKHDESIMIADSEDEFASQMARLAGSTELIKKTGEKAREVIRDHYQIDQIGVQIDNFYKELA